uniref:Uncharacterized protein n=1 Tax=viral metagenome TaxID=1070528 RepID=A0A6C0I7M6_9ZZZZ
MEILELFYIALGTIGVLIVLHLGTFWIARIIKPPAPKIVYVQAPPAAVAAPPQAPQAPQAPPPPPPPPPVLSETTPNIQLPLYDTPPPKAVPQLGALPPPLETRNTTKQSGGDIGPPR